MLSVTRFVEILRLLGFQNLAAAENYGHSLALGAADVSVWELAGAYRSLALGGFYQNLQLFKEETPGSRSSWLHPKSAFIIQKILSDRSSRSITFGLENSLATPFWTVVKTGTSKDMRDNWCAGFSSRYTVVVWVGNADGSPMWNVTGITGAAPVWREVMNALHKNESSVEPEAPPGVELASFVNAKGIKVREWFLSGTAPDTQKLADRRWGLRIAHPLDGSLIAFDPDIPDTQQALFFRASGALPKGGRWALNDKVLADDSIRLSLISNGRHRLEIRGSEGNTVDAVEFEVRGGSLPL